MAVMHRCANCGDSYPNTKARNTGHCSARCRDIDKIKQMTRPCEECNNDFVARRSTARYCSQACKQKARRARETKKRNESKAAIGIPPKRRENFTITTSQVEELIALWETKGKSADCLRYLARRLEMPIDEKIISYKRTRNRENHKKWKARQK